MLKLNEQLQQTGLSGVIDSGSDTGNEQKRRHEGREYFVKRKLIKISPIISTKINQKVKKIL